MKTLKVFFCSLVGIVLPGLLFAYTPLVTSTTFDGVAADVNLTALAILGIMIVIAALGMIVRGILGR